MNVVANVSELIERTGDEIGVSDWFLITQDQVDSFADVTQDHQFIHTRPDQAALTPFGGTIAHGFLSLSMLSYFASTGCGISIEGAKLFINYGFDKVRFIHPVRVGLKIRACAQLISVEERKSGEILLKQHVSVEIENIKKPALIADWLTMIVP